MSVRTLPPYVHPSMTWCAGKCTAVYSPLPALGMRDGRTDRGASTARKGGREGGKEGGKEE